MSRKKCKVNATQQLKEGCERSTRRCRGEQQLNQPQCVAAEIATRMEGTLGIDIRHDHVVIWAVAVDPGIALLHCVVFDPLRATRGLRP